MIISIRQEIDIIKYHKKELLLFTLGTISLFISGYFLQQNNNDYYIACYGVGGIFGFGTTTLGCCILKNYNRQHLRIHNQSDTVEVAINNYTSNAESFSIRPGNTVLFPQSAEYIISSRSLSHEILNGTP